MTTHRRYHSADLELFPDDGKRYEIIDGELYVSKQPSLEHQIMCAEIVAPLVVWNTTTDAGRVAVAPGLIFADDQDVAPDLAWISHASLATAIESDRHLHAAPELVVEVLSPGSANRKRDRQIKLDLYSRRGVREYWIIDWENRQVEVHRRSNDVLSLAATLLNGDVLESPLLPGFSLQLADLFARLPNV
jgi:Uma2 family endonuclease